MINSKITAQHSIRIRVLARHVRIYHPKVFLSVNVSIRRKPGRGNGLDVNVWKARLYSLRMFEILNECNQFSYKRGRDGSNKMLISVTCL